MRATTGRKAARYSGVTSVTRTNSSIASRAAFASPVAAATSARRTHAGAAYSA
jgi:hypothetical protein